MQRILAALAAGWLDDGRKPQVLTQQASEASAAAKMAEQLLLLAPKELFTWWWPKGYKPLFEDTPVLNNNFEHLGHDDFGD